MKKICVVTATRAEYGYLKWLIKDISEDKSLELQLVVTGSHLCKEQGYTIDVIKKDGFNISKSFDAKIDSSSSKTICETMARYTEGFSKMFEELKPDCVVVLGDRYELLPICSTAFIMKIPIVHLCGGDITAGALDDGVRNAVTMMAEYHFPITKESAKNIIRMRGNDNHIYPIGSTSLDTFNRMNLMSRKELAENLSLNENKKWALCTFHAETKESIEYNISTVDNMLSALQEINNFQIVITKANTDLGGIEINEKLEAFVRKHNENFRLIPSLGQLRYLSFMKQASLVIGNSSSGILESPFLAIPSVNIGNRQKGRYLCNNVVQSEVTKEEILKAINEALCKEITKDDIYYYGDGHATEKILEVLKNE